MTYKQAQHEALQTLRLGGWNVVTHGSNGKALKVPHATSPDVPFRMYFKARSIHHQYSVCGLFSLKNARSAHVQDLRKVTCWRSFLVWANRRALGERVFFETN